MKFGFTNSTLKLNKNIANLEEWNEQEIEKRASEWQTMHWKFGHIRNWI